MSKELERKIREICTYYSELGEGTAGYDLSEEKFQKLFQLIDGVAKDVEINRIKITLSRINLNESNAYPLIDDSANLKDVKEALMNRLKQLQNA